MKKRVKIALIDGLPYTVPKQVEVYNTYDDYTWDSDFFGVPEFRMHGEKMLKIIREENPDAQVIICPFYSKYESVYKNYKLLARSIIKAVSEKALIISISLEVLGVKYLSVDILQAYKYAFKNRVLILVSAGNEKTFLNPLIHKKYTIPIIGITNTNKIPHNLWFEKKKSTFGYGIYGGERYLGVEKDEKIYCSIATARFAGQLSILLSKFKNNDSNFSIDELVSKICLKKGHIINIKNTPLLN